MKERPSMNMMSTDWKFMYNDLKSLWFAFTL